MRSPVGRKGIAALSESLDARALAEFVVVDATLHAVVVADGRACLHDLGPVDRVTAEIEWVRFALQRLAVDGAAARDVERPLTALARAAGKLDALLIEPLAARLGDRPLLILPTAAPPGPP